MNNNREKGIAELITAMLEIKDTTAPELFVFALKALLQTERGRIDGIEYLDKADQAFLKRIFLIELVKIDCKRQLDKLTENNARQLLKDIFNPER